MMKTTTTIQNLIQTGEYRLLAASILEVPPREITDFDRETKGMTNLSFRFHCGGRSYFMRVPGAGTEEMINRREEALVFQRIAHLDVSDETIFCDPETGLRVAVYYENSRTCSDRDWNEVTECFGQLRRVHTSGLTVPHHWSYLEKLDEYESYCMQKGFIKLPGYGKAREKANQLMDSLDEIAETPVLCHVDCASINFLVLPEENRIRVIDWEYGAMFDPLIDVSHFALHSRYTQEEADRLLSIYLEREPTDNEFLRLYGYMALGGLVWALWTEYKEDSGCDFGDYGMNSYQSFRKYSRILKHQLVQA